MKKFSLLLAVFILSVLAVRAQWPETVTPVQALPNDTVVVAGNLSAGKTMDDLSWAASSSNACFPATQNVKFRGPHVFYATQLPPRSVLVVTVTPDNPAGDLSLYGYMIGGEEYRLVPDLPRCITCEADHKWDRPVRGRVQTAERKIEFQNPTQNTYNILIGVTAPQGVTEGAFSLRLKLRS